MLPVTEVDEPLPVGPLGVMADLHGNRPAVEAVIEDARSAGVERWLILGDVVAMGAEPAAVLGLLDRLDVVVAIAGNTERYVLTGDRPDPSLEAVAADPSLLPRLVDVVASFAWTRGHLSGAGMLGRIGQYVSAASLRLPDGTSILAVHASPVADDGVGITTEADDEDLAPLFADGRATAPPVVVGGHTHTPTDRVVAGRRLLNPGSISNPLGDDKSARYLILRCSDEGWEPEFRSVAYDVERYRRLVIDSGLPGSHFILGHYFG